jgi:GNAT superfamily N-acetyltransferase
MRKGDIPYAISLSDQENWGITRGDLTRILRLDPKSSLIALIGAERVGLATTTSYGRTLAWIGNVIVDRKYRGRHIGQTLVQAAVEYLQRRRIAHIALYCFNDNVKFYRKFGFKKDASFMRLQRMPLLFPHASASSTSGRRLTLREVLRADKKAFGADRSRLIRTVLRTKAGWYEGISNRRSTKSFLLVKKYREMYEFGPWVCLGPGETLPRELLQLAISKTAKKPIEVSCLRSHRRSLRLLQENGFKVTNNGHRMYLGEIVKIGDDEANYAVGFLDKG